MKSDVLTVSEYSSRLGQALRQVGPAALEGEVQKASVTQRGMLYFDLTDGEATLSCKVFPREVGRLEHHPRSGDLVCVQVDRPDLYAARGSLSLVVSQVALAGEGELLRRRQELIARLTREGFCDSARWRPLPRFPRTVGVIAGAGSEGMSDVIRALTDRWPPAQIVTCPSIVQGKTAPRSLINALATFQEHRAADVIIMARGGGSVQDLACFDDEDLCRALFACEIPVVCAIGHTDNNPVSNHVTWSAHTPSRSAEMVVPSIVEVRQTMGHAREFVDSAPGKLQLTEESLRVAASRLDARTVLAAREREVTVISSRVMGALREFFTVHAAGLGNARTVLATAPKRAALEFANEHATLTAARATLERTSYRLSSLATQTSDIAGRITGGINRQLTDHRYNYARAAMRLMIEARAGLERRDRRQRELIVRAGELLRVRAHDCLDRAGRELTHLAEVITARDFRHHGWLLATKSGQPVRSVTDLRRGDRLELQLQDGRAEAAVEQVHPDNHGSNTP
ncbi:MAG TPA: exodeoxyribonuclease VII large subunit [Solirubrobacteraceae bacterium]|nr:exodeoxyribonuclease VII large subunit [Solirubrobacteraceae bacterium]